MGDKSALTFSRGVRYKVDTDGVREYFLTMETKHTTEAKAVQDLRKETETLARVSSVEYFSSYSFGDSGSYAERWNVSKHTKGGEK